MVLSMDSQGSVSCPQAIQATGRLTLALVGFNPHTEYTGLSLARFRALASPGHTGSVSYLQPARSAVRPVFLPALLRARLGWFIQDKLEDQYALRVIESMRGEGSRLDEIEVRLE